MIILCGGHFENYLLVFTYFLDLGKFLVDHVTCEGVVVVVWCSGGLLGLCALL